MYPVQQKAQKHLLKKETNLNKPSKLHILTLYEMI
jgi:hypothetical protein